MCFHYTLILHYGFKWSSTGRKRTLKKGNRIQSGPLRDSLFQHFSPRCGGGGGRVDAEPVIRTERLTFFLYDSNWALVDLRCLQMR